MLTPSAHYTQHSITIVSSASTSSKIISTLDIMKKRRNPLLSHSRVAQAGGNMLSSNSVVKNIYRTHSPTPSSVKESMGWKRMGGQGLNLTSPAMDTLFTFFQH